MYTETNLGTGVTAHRLPLVSVVDYLMSHTAKGVTAHSLISGFKNAHESSLPRYWCNSR